MDRYTEIRSFVLVTEKGSFAAAAVVEGVTPVVMGRRLDALERRLGVRLMHRSTRGLSLTALGEQFLEPAASCCATSTSPRTASAPAAAPCAATWWCRRRRRSAARTSRRTRRRSAPSTPS